jgi:hypothetical protein
LRFHFTRLVTLLAIHGLSSLAWAQQDPIDQRLHSVGYSACDAVILARAWGQPTSQMKDWILSKVGDGMQSTLETDLHQARNHQHSRNQLRCTYREAGFSYSDAQALAGAWGTEMSETKARIGWATARGLRAWIIADLKKAGSPMPQATPSLNPDLEAFASSRFNQCDATLLARMWGESVHENKKFIGMKVLGGSPEYIDDYLRSAREKISRGDLAKCAWTDTGYSYADAQVLSREWGISTWDAKQRAANKLTWGLSEVVDASIRSPRTPH